MRDTPRVTIILPTYNRAGLIPSSIQSVIEQTYTDWELIVSDDGSTDESCAVVKAFAAKDKRMVYRQNTKNLGLPENRNVALKEAKGELIMFIEDDLVLARDCLERLVRTHDALASHGTRLGAVCPSLIVNDSDHSNRRRLLGLAARTKGKQLEKNPVFISPFTGLIFRNYSSSFKEPMEVVDCHACSLYDNEVFSFVNYSAKVYSGTHIGEETELHFQLRKFGYKLYFDPGAIAHHNIVSTGGCRTSQAKWTYFYIRNHMLFLVRNFRAKSIFMIPCFLIFNFTIIAIYPFGRLVS